MASHKETDGTSPITKSPKVYVAGAYRAPTRDAVEQNIAHARKIGLQAVKKGWNPLVPHAMFGGMDEMAPEVNDEQWLRLTMEWMRECDAVVLVGNHHRSAGTAAEVEEAGRLGIPVYKAAGLPRAHDFKPVDRDTLSITAEVNEELFDNYELAAAIERTCSALATPVMAKPLPDVAVKALTRHLIDLQTVELIRCRAPFEFDGSSISAASSISIFDGGAWRKEGAAIMEGLADQVSRLTGK